MSDEVTIAKRVEQYVALRDQIKAIEEKHKKELEPFRETEELIQGWLQKNMEAAGTTSVATASGTAYLTTRYTASLADPDAFMNFVVNQGLFELMDRRANATAVKDYVQERGALPPGVNLNGITRVGVRRAS